MVVGGVVGNNRKKIEYVYNIAEEIKAKDGDVGGISGNQNIQNNASISYVYNISKITGTTNLGGIVGGFFIGTVNRAYNIGILNTSLTTNIGQIGGIKYNISAITNSSGTTESEMKGWSESTITTNLGNFVKKDNSLPILNITVRDITF